MRTFVLRARAAPTDSRKLLASVGTEAHAEILAHTLMNAIFVAQSHRADVVVLLRERWRGEENGRHRQSHRGLPPMHALPPSPQPPPRAVSSVDEG